MGSARVVSVNVSLGVDGAWAGRMGRTAIDKRPVDGPVRIGRERVAGDDQIDRERHGGPDRAAYAYASEDAAFWSEQLGRSLGPGAFGENLTLAGVEVTGALIGEVWSIGTAVLQVSSPRKPCRVFAAWLDQPDLIRRFTAAGRPGAYLRVLTPGVLAAGDPVGIVQRPRHGVTLGEAFRALTGEPALLPRLLAAPELGAEDRDTVLRRLGRTESA